MALPRETILQALKTQMQGITSASGFNNTIKTVSIGYEFPDERNRSDHPLVIIGPMEDIDDRETEGAQTANRYHRQWSMVIRAAMIPLSTADPRAEGEKLLDDIVKKLTSSKTFGIQGGAFGFTLDRLLDANDFEADQSGRVYVGVDLTVGYNFTNSSI